MNYFSYQPEEGETAQAIEMAGFRWDHYLDQSAFPQSQFDLNGAATSLATLTGGLVQMADFNPLANRPIDPAVRQPAPLGGDFVRDTVPTIIDDFNNQPQVANHAPMTIFEAANSALDPYFPQFYLPHAGNVNLDLASVQPPDFSVVNEAMDIGQQIQPPVINDRQEADHVDLDPIPSSPVAKEELDQEHYRTARKAQHEASLTFTGSYQGMIDSLEEADQLLAEFATINDRLEKTKLTGTNDFPTDINELHDLNRQLFNAIKDFPSGLGATRRSRTDGSISESVHVKHVRALPDAIIEALGWKILDAIRKAQDRDVGLHEYGPMWHHDKFASFKDRFAAVKNFLKMNKAAVNDLLKHDPLMRICSGPVSELDSEASNLELNRNRSHKNTTMNNAVRSQTMVLPVLAADTSIKEAKRQVRAAKSNLRNLSQK